MAANLTRLPFIRGPILFRTPIHSNIAFYSQEYRLDIRWLQCKCRYKIWIKILKNDTKFVIFETDMQKYLYLSCRI